MMKAYVKPILVYENFELSQHIAACSIDMNSTEQSCTTGGSGTVNGITYSGLFDSGKCAQSIADYDESYCYFAGSDEGKSAVELLFPPFGS